jgi:hypothetical protein
MVRKESFCEQLEYGCISSIFLAELGALIAGTYTGVGSVIAVESGCLCVMA